MQRFENFGRGDALYQQLLKSITTNAITTNEVARLEMLCVKQSQRQAVNDLKFAGDKEQLQ